MTPVMLPTVPLDAPEAERLRAATAAIEALRRRRAERGRVPPVRSVEVRASSPASTAPAMLLVAVCLVGTGVVAGYLAARATPVVMGDRNADVRASLAASHRERVAGLEAENAGLKASVAALESETTALQSELLRADLDRFSGPSGAGAGSGPSDAPASVERAPDASVVARPESEDDADVGLEETSGLLAAAGVDERSIPAIAAAFDAARRELERIEIGRENPSSNFATVSEARRQVRERLVAAIGVDGVVVGRHALGEPNLLAVGVADASDPATSALRVGDILLSVDGERVVDLEQLRWIENEAGDRADDAGESGERHVLVVLRDGARIEVVFDAPLGLLMLEPDSVSPAVFE